MLIRLVLAVALLIARSSTAPVQNQPPADLVLAGGNVLTVDTKFTVASAFAVRDGRFIRIGSNGDIRALIGPGTRVIEAHGRTVIPGLIDTHVHALTVASEEAVQP